MRNRVITGGGSGPRGLLSLGFEAHRSALLLRLRWHHSRELKLRSAGHNRDTTAADGPWPEMDDGVPG
ncbi:MAG: hypothetical protein WBB07_20725 [Mycobacterium sp.]